MALVALISLVAGVLCGSFLFPSESASVFSQISTIALYLIMFSVGISVGCSKSFIQKLRSYNLTVFLIPFGIILGSAIGGAICSVLLQIPMHEGLSIASGLGWYSLSGVLMTNLAGAEIGAIAFLSNLLREIFSFFLIPWIVKHFNAYTAIAPAGATSEDTTLPMMLRHTSEDVVVLSVLNGTLCSAAVPVLIHFFYYCAAHFS